MTYEEARKFIDSSNQYGSRPGLETITELLKRLGNPQDKLKVIHVAGTNGKGSTSAFIASILASGGYLVGRYVSPAVFSYRERIQITHFGVSIDTDYITEQGVAASIELIKPACEAMLQDGFSHPTSFEIETTMAFLYLMGEQVDFAVIEVGMGGRLDATNVIKHPVCSVITSISMDHMQYLGDTIEQIAVEKAGIIKKGAPVITGNQNLKVLSVLRKVCDDLGTSLTVVDSEITNIIYSPEGTKFNYREQKLEIALLGEYQINNAVLAIETTNTICNLGYFISDSNLKIGLLQTRWSGRFEIVARNPYFIIDGAHNEDAALKLKKTLQTYFPDRKLIFIMGVLADKEYRKILEITAGFASTIITLTPNNTRALASSKLAEAAGEFTEGKVIDAVTVSRAVKIAYENAKGKDDIILAFGSLSYLGELCEVVKGQLITSL